MRDRLVYLALSIEFVHKAYISSRGVVSRVLHMAMNGHCCIEGKLDRLSVARPSILLGLSVFERESGQRESKIVAAIWLQYMPISYSYNRMCYSI